MTEEKQEQKFTQDEVNEIIQKRINKLKEKQEAEAKLIEEEVAKIEEQKNQAVEEMKQAKVLIAEAEKIRQENVKLQIAREYGLNDKAYELLTATDVDGLKSQATTILDIQKSSTAKPLEKQNYISDDKKEVKINGKKFTV